MGKEEDSKEVEKEAKEEQKVEPTSQTPKEEPEEGEPREETTSEIIEVVGKYSKELIDIIKAGFGEWRKSQKITSNTNFRTFGVSLLAVSIIIILIVGSALWLTSQNLMEGSTFAFLLGTIVGYLLTVVSKGAPTK